MAIREVLKSFTFEQQRQMINLIGVDIGDVSTLLTPTLEVVTAINEIITGDVDLSNQTIGMDPGTLSSPSLFWDVGQGFYKVSSTKLGLSTSLAIAGDLEVDGNITFRAGNGSGGTLTFGDLDTDNIIFNADVQSSIVPDSSANYNLGSSNKQWNNLWIDGTASIDTLTVDENATITGYLSVTSGDVRVPNTQTVVDLFDDHATTVEAFGAGTSVRLGATSGTFTIRNPTLVGTEITQNVYNTVATTVNAFGAATNIFMGVALGGGPGTNSNFTIRSDDTILDGDLNVNGGEILSSQNTFDLLINNGDIRIGSVVGTGETVINNSLNVKGNLNISNSASSISIIDNAANSLEIKEGSNTYVTINTADGSERIILNKDVYIVGNLDVTGSNTIINTSTLSVDDKNITLADTASPSDSLADGGGITLKGTTDKTITYSNTNSRWQSNIAFNATAFELDDNQKILVGTGDDLEIYHSGSFSFINDKGDGGLYIQTNGDQLALREYTTGEYFVKCITSDMSTELYYDNLRKLQTTSTGVTVTGNLSATTVVTTDDLNLASAKVFKIDSTTVLSSTQVLGKGFTNSAGEIVTTDGTQTLTNKTLNGTVYGNSNDGGDSNTVINAATTELYHKQVSFTADRTIQVSNLVSGRKVTIWVRNTNASARNITFQASSTTTGYNNVLISTSSFTTLSTFSLPASTGTICVTIFNANGNIVGCVG